MSFYRQNLVASTILAAADSQSSRWDQSHCGHYVVARCFVFETVTIEYEEGGEEGGSWCRSWWCFPSPWLFQFRSQRGATIKSTAPQPSGILDSRALLPTLLNYPPPWRLHHQRQKISTKRWIGFVRIMPRILSTSGSFQHPVFPPLNRKLTTALALLPKSYRNYPGSPALWSIPVCAALTAYGGYIPQESLLT